MPTIILLVFPLLLRYNPHLANMELKAIAQKVSKTQAHRRRIRMEEHHRKEKSQILNRVS